MEAKNPTASLPAAQQRGARLPELAEIMERLLAADGCPWDREQSLAHGSRRSFD